jgi:hypothetical protein
MLLCVGHIKRVTFSKMGAVDWVCTLLMNLVVADVYWCSTIILVCEDVPSLVSPRSVVRCK